MRFGLGPPNGNLRLDRPLGVQWKPSRGPTSGSEAHPWEPIGRPTKEGEAE